MDSIEFIRASRHEVETVYKCDRKYSQFHMHLHNDYEVFFCRSNGHKFFVGNKIYEANTNDLFMFDNTDIHKISVSTEGGYARYVTNFSPHAFKQYFPKNTQLLDVFDKRSSSHIYKLSLTEPRAQELLKLLDKMENTFRSNGYARSVKLKLELCELLLFINEERELQNTDSSKANTKVSQNNKVNEIVYYINQNFNTDLSLDGIAKKYFVDKYYLCRLFKNETGFGINDYIKSCRLSHAVNLLQKGLPVSEVSDKCGFGSDTYFIATFTKALGISPKKYSLSARGIKAKPRTASKSIG